jgi:hypothetical protein
MENVDLFYGHLVYFTAIRSILWTYCTFGGNLVCCTKKNLATLVLVVVSIEI